MLIFNQYILSKLKRLSFSFCVFLQNKSTIRANSHCLYLYNEDVIVQDLNGALAHVKAHFSNVIPPTPHAIRVVKTFIFYSLFKVLL